MKKIFLILIHVFIILLGLFLLAGMIALHLLFHAKTELSPGMFFYYIDVFEKNYYSVIPYHLSVNIMFFVPFWDLFVLYKIFKSKGAMKFYWLITLLLYTGFFVFRFLTVSA